MKFLPKSYGTTWLLILTIAMAFWATQYPINKALSGLDPFLYSTLRFFFAAITLIPFVLNAKIKSRPSKKDVILFIITGIIMGSISALIFIGISLSHTIIAAIIVNSNPLWIAIIAPFTLKENFPLKKLPFILIGVLGVAISSLNGHSISTILNSNSTTGVLLLIASAILIAIYTISTKKLVASYGAIHTNFFLITIGSIIFIPIIIANQSINQIPEFSLETWLLIIAAGAVATALPYTLWKTSMNHLSSTVASSFKLLIPIFATIYALLFLNESLTIYIATGILLTTIAVYQVQKKHQS